MTHTTAAAESDLWIRRWNVGDPGADEVTRALASSTCKSASPPVLEEDDVVESFHGLFFLFGQKKECGAAMSWLTCANSVCYQGGDRSE